MRGKDLVEVAAIGQPGQRIVQRIVLDAGLGGFQLDIAGFGQRIGPLQALAQLDVRGDVPVDADDPGRLSGIPVDHAALADVAQLAAVEQHAVLGLVASVGRDGPLEILARAGDVVGMQHALPMRIVARAAIGGIAAQFVHAVVPDQFVGLDVHFPDADLRGVEGQLQPARQALQLDFAPLQLADVLHPLADQTAGHDGGDHDQAAGKQDEQPELPDVGRGDVPAALGNRGDLPRAGGQNDIGDDRIVLRRIGGAEEPGALDALGVATGNGDLDRQILVEKSAVTIEAVHIDDRGDDTPECLAAMAIADEHRQPGNEAAAALDQIDRPGDDRLARIAGPQSRLALRRVLAVVEADRPLVALQGVHQRDDHVRRGGDVAQLRFFGEQICRQLREAILLHLRLRRQRRDQAAQQLDVAVDVALEPVADQADPAKHLGAQALFVHPPVLIFGKQRGNDDDEQRQRRRDVGRPQDQAQCVAKGVAPGCQVHQLAARPEVGPLQTRTYEQLLKLRFRKSPNS